MVMAQPYICCTDVASCFVPVTLRQLLSRLLLTQRFGCVSCFVTGRRMYLSGRSSLTVTLATKPLCPLPTEVPLASAFTVMLPPSRGGGDQWASTSSARQWPAAMICKAWCQRRPLTGCEAQETVIDSGLESVMP